MKKLTSKQSASVIKGLKNIGIEYLAYLPDSTMQGVISHFESEKGVTVVPLSREDEGIGIISGLVASGRKAVLLIQDSGIGNILNSYVTLVSLYRIPMLTIAARRGGFGEYNMANAEFGEIAVELIAPARQMGFILDYKVPLNRWSHVVKQAYNYSHFMRKPIILFVNLKDEK